jgi:tetratricopeptide (TPR) repeat protein
MAIIDDSADSADSNREQGSEWTGTLTIDFNSGRSWTEVPVDADDSPQRIELKKRVAEQLAAIVTRSPDEEIESLLREDARDVEWADRVLHCLHFRRFHASDAVFSSLRDEIAKGVASVALRLRYACANILARRGESELALGELTAAEALIDRDDDYAFAIEYDRAQMLFGLGRAEAVEVARRVFAATGARPNDRASGKMFLLWADYECRRKAYDVAFTLFDQASLHLQRCETNEYLYNLLDTAERYCGIHQGRAIAQAKLALQVLEKGALGTSSEAAAARLTIAQVLMTESGAERDLAIAQVNHALSIFRRLVGYEDRAASCASLLSALHRDRGNAGIAAGYAVDHQLWLDRLAEGDGRLLGEVARAADSEEIAALAGLEPRVILTSNVRVAAAWACSMSSLLAKTGEPAQALALLDEVERRVASSENDGHMHELLGGIYVCRAEAFERAGRTAEAAAALIVAADHLPGDLGALSIACPAALNVGRYEDAIRLADQLIAVHRGAPGAHRIKAMAYARMQDYQAAAAVLKAAMPLFPDDTEVPRAHQQAVELMLGLRATEGPPRGVPAVELPSVVPPHVDREIDRLPLFHRDVATAILELIVDLQRTPPHYLSTGYTEADFRDHVFQRLSMRWPQTYAEPRAGRGLVDVTVSDADRKQMLVIELKVWGRNDFLSVSQQAIGYATERDPAVAVVMINPGTEDISSTYIERVVLRGPGYVVGSFRRNPLDRRAPRLQHFVSQHQDGLGRPVLVFHFICNFALTKSRRVNRRT